jgi:hypothetical protein
LSRLDLCRGALALASWLLIAQESPKLIHNGGPQLVLLYAALATAGLIVVVVPRVLFRGGIRMDESVRRSAA